MRDDNKGMIFTVVGDTSWYNAPEPGDEPASDIVDCGFTTHVTSYLLFSELFLLANRWQSHICCKSLKQTSLQLPQMLMHLILMRVYL